MSAEAYVNPVLIQFKQTFYALLRSRLGVQDGIMEV